MYSASITALTAINLQPKFQLITLVSRKEKRVQILVGKWSKKKESKNGAC